MLKILVLCCINSVLICILILACKRRRGGDTGIYYRISYCTYSFKKNNGPVNETIRVRKYFDLGDITYSYRLVKNLRKNAYSSRIFVKGTESTVPPYHRGRGEKNQSSRRKKKGRNTRRKKKQNTTIASNMHFAHRPATTKDARTCT